MNVANTPFTQRELSYTTLTLRLFLGLLLTFTAINKFTSRATWSNINNGAMNTLATIYNDKALLSQVETERSVIYQQIYYSGRFVPQVSMNSVGVWPTTFLK